jgi:hypothetical protein
MTGHQIVVSRCCRRRQLQDGWRHSWWGGPAFTQLYDVEAPGFSLGGPEPSHNGGACTVPSDHDSLDPTPACRRCCSTPYQAQQTTNIRSAGPEAGVEAAAGLHFPCYTTHSDELSSVHWQIDRLSEFALRVSILFSTRRPRCQYAARYDSRRGHAPRKD